MTSTPLKTLPSSEISVEQVRESHREELEAIARYLLATNYLAAAQIYLKDNVLLKEPRPPKHIKDRLLGHRGICPGINLVYAHLNTMRDAELEHQYTGYGYQVQIVKDPDLDADLYASMDWAYREICRIQQAARTGERISQPSWPILIRRSPKGWTGIKEIGGEPIEGSFRSLEVPAIEVKKNPQQLQVVEDPVQSYRPEELFDELEGPIQEIVEQCPKGDRRMGSNPQTFGGSIRFDLDLPDIFEFEVPVERAQAAGYPLYRREESTVSNIEQAVPQSGH